MHFCAPTKNHVGNPRTDPEESAFRSRGSTRVTRPAVNSAVIIGTTHAPLLATESIRRRPYLLKIVNFIVCRRLLYTANVDRKIVRNFMRCVSLFVMGRALPRSALNITQVYRPIAGHYIQTIVTKKTRTKMSAQLLKFNEKEAYEAGVQTPEAESLRA